VAVVPGIDYAPLAVAVQDGLFRQHGLNVTLKTYKSVDQEIEALSGGHANVAVGDYSAFFYQEANGARLRLIADGYDAAPDSIAILTGPKSGITVPQDLVGQPVAVPPAQVNQGVPNNIQTLAAEQVLQSDGLSPNSVRWQPMPMQSMIGELLNNSVKAILVTEPYILEAEAKLGAVEVLDSTIGVTGGLPLSGYFSLDSYVRAQPSAVQAFQAALSQAQSNASMRGPIQNVLPGLTGMSAQDAAMVTLGTYPAVLSIGQVQRVAQLMHNSGMTNNLVDVRSLVFP